MEEKSVIGLVVGIMILYGVHGALTNIDTAADIYGTNTNVGKEQKAEKSCNLIVNAFNNYFKSVYLDLEASKGKAISTYSDSFSCTVHFKNNSRRAINGMSGYIYYFDKNNVADKKLLWNNTNIPPQGIIKERLGLLPMDITKVEIKEFRVE